MTVNPELSPKCNEGDKEIGKWHTHPGFLDGDQFSADPNFSNGDKVVADTAFEGPDPVTGEKKVFYHPQNKNGVPLTLTSESRTGSGVFVTKSYQRGREFVYTP